MVNTTTLPDEVQLVARARGGDRQAFAALYEAYLDRVYRYVYFKVNGTAEAEDLCAQVFLKAWEKIERYQERGLPFGAWLFRIARNLVVDHYRTRRPSESLDNPGLARVDPAADVDGEVDRRMAFQNIRAALKGLTEDQRQVVVMKLIDGYSTEEISRAMGKKPGAIRALQMRGLQALAKALGRT